MGTQRAFFHTTFGTGPKVPCKLLSSFDSRLGFFHSLVSLFLSSFNGLVSFGLGSVNSLLSIGSSFSSRCFYSSRSLYHRSFYSRCFSSWSRCFYSGRCRHNWSFFLFAASDQSSRSDNGSQDESVLHIQYPKRLRKVVQFRAGARSICRQRCHPVDDAMRWLPFLNVAVTKLVYKADCNSL